MTAEEYIQILIEQQEEKLKALLHQLHGLREQELAARTAISEGDRDLKRFRSHLTALQENKPIPSLTDVQ